MQLISRTLENGIGQSGQGCAIDQQHNRGMTSADGISWTLRHSAADRQWSGLCWAAELGQLVAVAQNSSGSRVMLSS
jgi:hypothetical protein